MAAKGTEKLVLGLKKGKTFSVAKSFTADGVQSRRGLRKNDTVEYTGERVEHVTPDDVLEFTHHPKANPTESHTVYLKVSQVDGMLTA